MDDPFDWMGPSEVDPATPRIHLWSGERLPPRVAFLYRVQFGGGAADAPCFDIWTDALQERGWIKSNLDSNHYGAHGLPPSAAPIKNWTMTDLGRNKFGSWWKQQMNERGMNPEGPK